MRNYLLTLTMLVVPVIALGAPKAKKNEIRDSRDRQVYRTVAIGGKTWLGDNLNYAGEGSFCYKDDEDNCAAYGRLYTWNAARTACPTGFHLPTHEDFESLWNAAGGQYDAGYYVKTDYGWSGDANGNDTLKFSAMPAGNRFDDGTYGNLGKFTFFWTSDDKLDDIGAGKARTWFLSSKSVDFSYTSKAKDFGFSVRCVKD